MLNLARPLIPLLAFATLLSACGGQSPEAGRAAQTLTRAFHALAAGDGPTLCSLSTAAAQATLASAVPHSTCQQVVKIVSAHLTDKQRAAAASVRFGRVTVSGKQASVKASQITSARGTFKGFLGADSPPTHLAKQPDGSWKISG